MGKEIPFFHDGGTVDGLGWKKDECDVGNVLWSALGGEAVLGGTGVTGAATAIPWPLCGLFLSVALLRGRERRDSARLAARGTIHFRCGPARKLGPSEHPTPRRGGRSGIRPGLPFFLFCRRDYRETTPVGGSSEPQTRA
jgi:hypothetical protein